MKVELQHVTKTFRSKDRKNKTDVVAVGNVSYTFADGKLIGLLGPSGCGKSTMLNLISGLLKPTDGRIFFGDRDVTDIAPEKRGVGLVFQNYALYPHMSVMENILFPLENLKGKDKLSKDDMMKRVKDIAGLVLIDGLLDRKPRELSGGQQQRVAIARALVKMPKVLLLDEPLSNLDARLRLKTREEIKRIQRQTGITTVFVTHDQDEAMSISDEIVVMKEGVVQQIGAPQSVYDSPKNLFVAKFLGTPPINVLPGHLQDGFLFVGTQKILATEDTRTQEVYVGIRPEGFTVTENGHLACEQNGIEVMGRDISVLATHKGETDVKIRAIVPSEQKVHPQSETVCFDVKPNKVFVFDKQDEKRIFCSFKPLADNL